MTEEAIIQKYFMRIDGDRIANSADLPLKLRRGNNHTVSNKILLVILYFL